MALYILTAIGGSVAGSHYLHPFFMTGLGYAVHIQYNPLFEPFFEYFPSSVIIEDLKAIEGVAMGGPII